MNHIVKSKFICGDNLIGIIKINNIRERIGETKD